MGRFLRCGKIVVFMIRNRSTGEVISNKEIVCKSVFSQGWGLMFRRRANLVMVFDQMRKISLHNFFVFYPLEILVLDGDNKVVEIKQRFKPFTLFTASKRGKVLVELGLEGSKGKIRVGDRLNFN